MYVYLNFNRNIYIQYLSKINIYFFINSKCNQLWMRYDVFDFNLKIFDPKKSNRHSIIFCVRCHGGICLGFMWFHSFVSFEKYISAIVCWIDYDKKNMFVRKRVCKWNVCVCVIIFPLNLVLSYNRTFELCTHDFMGKNRKAWFLRKCRLYVG